MDYTDFRAIILDRCRNGFMPSKELSDGVWFVLGHMDRLTVHSLNRKGREDSPGFLEIIPELNRTLSAKKEKGIAYSQPIYILKEYEDWGERFSSVENFWNTQSAFMAFTRVHLQKSSQTELEKAVDSCLTKNEDVIHASDVDIIKEGSGHLGKKTAYLHYRTLEMGDIILVTKSDSAESILSCVKALHNLPEVGELYTYICLNQNELKQKEPGALSVTSDTIPLVSIRFAVKDVGKSHEVINALSSGKSYAGMDPSYFITGIEDINTIFLNQTSRQLCRILGFFSNHPAFWEAFYGSVTRLGLNEMTEEKKPSAEPKTSDQSEIGRIEDSYQMLRRDFFKLKEDAEWIDEDWVRPMSELLNCLTNISRDCVMRQICFILLDGMIGVVSYIKDIKREIRKDVLKTADLRETTEKIAFFMEHSIRMKVELVHQPEIRPLLFDIPANLLEFYVHFTKQCVRYLWKREEDIEDNDAKDNLLLVIPSVCEKITVEDSLNQEDETRRLLYIRVPMKLIYNPFHVICSLVHEIAHHSGEKTRMRDRRFEYIVDCCALLLTRAIGIKSEKAALYRIRETLDKDFPDKNKKYMKDIHTELDNRAGSLYRNDGLIGEIMTGCALRMKKSDNRAGWLNRQMEGYKIERRMENKEHILLELWEIEELYKEAYADLVMVTLLKLTSQEYMDLFLEFDEGNETTFNNQIVRMSLVIMTWDSNWTKLKEYSGKNSTEIKILEYMKAVSNAEMGVTSSFDGWHHQVEVVMILKRYLRECYEKIIFYDGLQQNQEELNEIRSKFDLTARHQRFASPDFYDFVEKCRKEMTDSSSVGAPCGMPTNVYGG